MNIIGFADEHYEGDPPSGKVIKHDQDVDHLVFSFRKVAAPGVNIAWELSHALLGLDCARKRFQLSEHQRDELLAAVFVAHSEAITRLEHVAKDRINIGMRAAAGLAIHWSESAEERATRHKHVWLDMHAYARILRNDLHNASLLGEIGERKLERQAAMIDELRQNSWHEEAS